MKALTQNPTTPTDDEDTVEGVGPTFKIFSGVLKAFERDDGRKYLSCTASSTVEDLHGDRMTNDCVMDMAPQARTKGMTIFLNHSYKVPEDVFGKTADAKIVSRASDADGNAIYDLDLEIMLNESNQRAIDTYASIKDQGMKMGVSIGAMIEDYDFIDEDAGWWGGLEIKKVNLLEASIVGIPANQRSWVVNALNALGAPKAVIAKALGRSYDIAEDPRTAKAAEALAPKNDATQVLEATEVSQRFFLNDVDITDQLDVKVTQKKVAADESGTFTITQTTPTFKSVTVKDENGNDITDDSDAPDDEESPSETEKSDDELDPADDKVASLSDAATALAGMKAAGADSSLAEIVLGFLEGATEEVASLRKALDEITKERDKLLEDVKAAAEIVETIAATPLGRKTQFTGPVSTFRRKFGGLYDEGFLQVLDGVDEDE